MKHSSTNQIDDNENANIDLNLRCALFDKGKHTFFNLGVSGIFWKLF